MEISMVFPQEVKNRIPVRSSNITLVIYPTELKWSLTQIRVHSSIIHSSQNSDVIQMDKQKAHVLDHYSALQGSKL